MSNLSDLLPAGAGAKVATFTASGTLPTGDTCILNSDGTATAIAASSSTTSQATQSAVQYEAGGVSEQACVYDTYNDKVIVFYRDNNNSTFGTAAVGTISGSTITFGTPVVFRSRGIQGGSAGQLMIAAAYDPTKYNTVVIYCNQPEKQLESVIVTVSGTDSLTASSHTVIDTDEIQDVTITYITDEDRFLLAYRNEDNSSYGYARRGTNNTSYLGTSSPVVFHSDSVSYLDSAYDSASGNRGVIAYKRSARPYAVGFTINGNTLTIGSTKREVASANGDQNQIIFDPISSKFIHIFRDEANSDYPTIVTYTQSYGEINNDVSSEQQLTTAGSGEDYSLVYDSNLSQVVATFRRGTQTQSVQITDASTNPPTVGSAFTISNFTYNEACAVYDPDTKNIVHFAAYTNSSNQGHAVVFNNEYVTTTTNLTSTNFLGIANQAIANSASGEIAVPGGVITNSSLLAQTFSFASSTQNTLRNGTHYNHAACFDSTNNKIVLAYDDGADNTTKAVVCTVSGGTMTFGTPVQVHGSRPNNIDIAFDSNAGKVVILYRDAGNSYGATAIVGTVSGTSISFGSSVAVDTSNSRNPVIEYDAYAQKVLVVYGDTGNSTYATGRVGTVSGDSISFGSETVLESVNTYPAGIAYDSTNQKCAIVYADTTNTKMKGAVASISGTSVSFGSATEIQSVLGVTGYNSLSTETVTYDSTAGAIVYVDADTTNGSFAYAGTISGTSITFGSQTVLNADTTPGYYHGVAHDSNSGKTLAFFAVDGASSYNEMSISGTTITIGTNKSLDSNPTDRIIAVTDTNLNKIVAFYVASNGDVVSEVFTGTGSATPLTVGSVYYVQDDGSISTTSSSQKAGLALSGTTLLLTG